MEQQHKVNTEIDINARISDVWSVLTDFERMPEWSSSFQGIDGDFRAGGRITSKFKSPLGHGLMTFDHELIDFKEGISFGWSDPLMLGMTDHHIYKLEPISENRTRFIQLDGVEGGHSRFFGKLMAKNMESMYLKFNQELKERVESLYPREQAD